ncbi:MAG: thioesterase family protein [Rhodobacteraceae bacterium]|nr:thioesterase family protein [Paracoccaceae bacterium]
MKDFILTGEGTVGVEWIDENSHMNMMWYTHLVDQASQVLFEKMEIAREDFTLVAARVVTIHRRELRLGDVWQTWSGLTDIANKSFTCTHKIVSAKGIAARSEMTVVPFDRNTRLSTEFSGNHLLQAKRFLVDGIKKLH